MGWNDHVEVVECLCLDCGEINEWEFWDDVAKRRYVGEIAALINLDPVRLEQSGKCPNCGSSRGSVSLGDANENE